MQILKIWQLSSLIFLTCLYEFIAGVELQSCLHPLKSEPCNLTCQVPDFSKAVQIKCNGTLRGSCSVFGCGANMTQDGGTTVLYKISSLSYINDICDWTCTYGPSSSSALYIPVYSGYSIAPSLTSQQNGDVVNLTATAECLFPSNPNVVVQYKEQGGQYISLSQLAVELQSSSGQGVCSFDIENRITAISDVSGRLTGLGGKSVVFRMKFLQYADAMPAYTNDEGPFYFNKSEGLTTPSSTISSDMPTTVSEPSSTISSDMPTTVSEVPPPPVTTLSAGLSQEIVITIISSISVLGAGGLILLIVLVVRHCRPKHKEIAAKNEKNHFAYKQGNLAKKNDLKSFKPQNSELSEKRNTNQGSIDKIKDAQLEIKIACKDRMYQHYPQTTDYLNIYGNRHVFNHSHTEESMLFYGNQHDNYPRPHSRPNNRMLYQSHYPEYPRHNEGMFQHYRADNLYRGQQMYQRPYGELYDMHIINDKQDDKRSSQGRPYEKNWDLLY